MNDGRFKSIMLAENGAKLIDDTNADTYAYRAIVIREDTVIEAWTDCDGLDLIAFYGIASETLFVTDPVLLVPHNKLSKSIKLTSGSIWGIK